MKKNRFVFFLLLLALMAVVCENAAAVQEARPIRTPDDAEEWITGFLGEHPEELDGAWQLSAQMEAAVNQMGGIRGLAQQLASLGTVREIGTPDFRMIANWLHMTVKAFASSLFPPISLFRMPGLLSWTSVSFKMTL